MQNLKRKIRNFIIIIFYLAGIPYLRFLWLRKKHGALIRIILFHEIKDNEVRIFKDKLSFLKKNFNIISPQQFYNQELSKKKLNILLTFDDGYKSWLKNVIPNLRRNNLSAILFIPSGFIEAGENNGDFYATKRLNASAKKPLNWQDVKKLDKMGFEIGGHTINHLILKELNRKKLLQEIRQDKEKIEKILEHRIISFAYPFGDLRIDSVAERMAKKAGYHYAFIASPGFNRWHTNRFGLHRDSLQPCINNILFKAWLYGGYDIIKCIINILRNR